MTPNRKKTLNGHKIEQFYWAGKQVVYLNDRLSHKTFDSITVQNVDEIHRNLLES